MSQPELIHFKVFDVSTLANSISGVHRFKDASKSLRLWLLSEIRTCGINVVRKGGKK